MLLRLLLVFVPIAIVAYLLGLPPAGIFVLSFLGIIPLASVLGEATEALARFTGPKIGGLLNATLGTLTEVIILFALLRSGQIEILKASIIGGILMSLLVTVGLALLLGGLKNGAQRYDQSSVGMSTSTMMLAVAGLLVPTLYAISKQLQERAGLSSTFQDLQVEEISVLVAVVLFALYLGTVVYQLRAPAGEEISQGAPESEIPQWSLRRTLGILVAATIGIAILGELLSDAVTPFGEALGLSPVFMGVALLPVAGGVSEMIVSVRMARKKKMDLGISIPMNGAMQGALFVAPLLVFLSLFGSQVLSLYFTMPELIAAALAVFITAYVAIDGVTNWLEGAQLLALWLIMALGFFFLVPAS